MSAIEDEAISVGGVSTLTRRSDYRSPMSAGHLNASTMSMRMKSQRKRRANRQHNNNFNAGYVPVEEEVLHKSGIRGRKRYFLYCTLILLLVIALLNSLVSVWLIFILGFSHDGLTTMEITSMEGREFLRVLADANIINLTFSDQAFLGARMDESLMLSTQAQDLLVRGGNSKLTLTGGSLTLATDKFTVTDSEQRSVTLDLSNITETGMVTNLYADNVTAYEISALEEGRKKDLYLESIGTVSVEGSKGVKVISGSDVNVDAVLSEVLLESETAVSLDGEDGIYLNRTEMKGPQPLTPGLGPLTYKVCICSSGSLFVVPGEPGANCDILVQTPSVCQ